VHQLKMELAGYQSCCKRLGDDLAAKDQELEGQLMLSWQECIVMLSVCGASCCFAAEQQVNIGFTVLVQPARCILPQNVTGQNPKFPVKHISNYCVCCSCNYLSLTPI